MHILRACQQHTCSSRGSSLSVSTQLTLMNALFSSPSCSTMRGVTASRFLYHSIEQTKTQTNTRTTIDSNMGCELSRSMNMNNKCQDGLSQCTEHSCFTEVSYVPSPHQQHSS